MTRLRFMHIPKTAGTTFTNILERQYSGKGFVFKGYLPSDIERFRALSEHDRNSIELFTGHAPITSGIPEADNATIITFFREPVTRVKSFCQHVSEGKSAELVRDFPPESFKLDEFLRSGNSQLSNLQTKFLVKQDIRDFPIETLPESEAKDIALDNLSQKVSCFGLQEYFDESLLLLATRFNWKMPIYIPANRANRQRLIEFKEHHIERIAELNSIDIELYKACKERFLNTIQSEEFDKAKLARFRIYKTLASYSIRAWGRVKRVRRRRTGKLFRSGAVS